MEINAEKVMTLTVQVGPVLCVGETPEGLLNIIPIIGGSVTGKHIQGKVCHGGADWNVSVSPELCHVLARYWIQTDDGAVIAIRNEGWLDSCKPNAVFKTTPTFACDINGPYAHLMRGCYAGELKSGGEDCVEIVVWKLT